jgi:hypothetical protein
MKCGFYKLQSVYDGYREVTADIWMHTDLVRYWIRKEKTQRSREACGGYRRAGLTRRVDIEAATATSGNAGKHGLLNPLLYTAACI